MPTPLDALRQLTASQLGIPVEAISQRADELYLQGGETEGQSVEHWLEAERQLISEYLPRPARLRSVDVPPAPRPRKTARGTKPKQGARTKKRPANGG